jgi:hypothetical protein
MVRRQCDAEERVARVFADLEKGVHFEEPFVAGQGMHRGGKKGDEEEDAMLKVERTCPQFTRQFLLCGTQTPDLPLSVIEQVLLHLADGDWRSLVANVNAVGSVDIFRGINQPQRLGVTHVNHL